ncbi:hypothetical protein KO504_05090 [Winogradskyella psychrotolerans]|uniref:hypothetical protein n=1 Tax=Winogradskyella TaxID=286104 RepID=UPI001C07543D|nr:hypothetical protein [Winogradskyella psychrotolerans]MBU2920705.1 hypothetical protein [Winogradskyella psychrotolerans]
MKKIYVIVFTVFLSTAFFSCNPESLVDEIAPQACCDEGEDIPPPPPPPDPVVT